MEPVLMRSIFVPANVGHHFVWGELDQESEQEVFAFPTRVYLILQKEIIHFKYHLLEWVKSFNLPDKCKAGMRLDHSVHNTPARM